MAEEDREVLFLAGLFAVLKAADSGGLDLTDEQFEQLLQIARQVTEEE